MRIQTVVDAENLTKRVHGKIMRDVNEVIAKYHRDKRVGKHFQRNMETAPGGPYGYRRRSTKTRAAKAKIGVDPSRPNFRTGQMMRDIQASGVITRTQYLWRWKARNPGFPLADWRREEIEAISRNEIRQDTARMEREYVKRARSPQYRRKRRRKVG